MQHTPFAAGPERRRAASPKTFPRGKRADTPGSAILLRRQCGGARLAGSGARRAGLRKQRGDRPVVSGMRGRWRLGVVRMRGSEGVRERRLGLACRFAQLQKIEGILQIFCVCGSDGICQKKLTWGFLSGTITGLFSANRQGSFTWGNAFLHCHKRKKFADGGRKRVPTPARRSRNSAMRGNEKPADPKQGAILGGKERPSGTASGAAGRHGPGRQPCPERDDTGSSTMRGGRRRRSSQKTYLQSRGTKKCPRRKRAGTADRDRQSCQPTA